LNIFKR